MTQQRAGEIERAVFYKYLETMKKDLNEADTSIVFEVGRTIGFMQKSLYDELSKEVEHYEDRMVSE